MNEKQLRALLNKQSKKKREAAQKKELENIAPRKKKRLNWDNVCEDGIETEYIAVEGVFYYLRFII